MKTVEIPEDMEQAKEQFRDIYKSVLKKFPDIKEEEIGINPKIFGVYYIGISATIRKPPAYKWEPCPLLHIVPRFFELTQEEQEATLAHELGHYVHYKKNLDIKRLLRQDKWKERMEYYDSSIKSLDEIKDLGKSEQHELKRLQKWRVLDECFADTEAAKAGYGKVVLKLLKHLKEKHPLVDSQPLFKLEVDERIKNLERIIEKTTYSE